MKKFLLACFAASVLAVGCGGGGGGGDDDGNPPPPPPPGGSGNVQLFLTGARQDSYDKLFMRLYSVELVKADNSAVKIFDGGDAGYVFDARSLNKNALNNFLYLGGADVAKGTYSEVRFTFDKDISGVARGATDFTDLDFAESDTTTGNKVLTLNINENIQGATDIIVNLPLNTWAVDRNDFIATLEEGTDTGLNDATRQVRTQFEGVIKSLSGTTRPTFIVDDGDATTGEAVKVILDENSNVYTDTGVMNTTLTNGSEVHVRGYWSEADNAFLATSVRVTTTIKTGDNDDVEGRVLSVSGDSFELRLDRTDGFFPQEPTVTVTTNANTMYFDRSGIMDTKEIFFDYIDSAGKDVEVEGTYNFTTNTVVAARVKAIDEAKEPETEVRGTATNINATARTFTVTVTDWAGAWTTIGSTYTVTINPDARIQDRLGNIITVDQFFTALATAQGVRATGSINGNTLAAKSVRLR